MTRTDYKTEAVNLWGAEPCGGDVGVQEGTPEFFQAVDRDRYGRYAPWLAEVARFGDFAGRRLLEIGCGMGTDLVQFARGGAKTIAIDLTPRHLQIARQRLALEGIAECLVRADAERLPFGDASFDVVYSFGVLHHTPSIESAVAGAHRVLTPGGLLIMAVYHRNSSFYWLSTLLHRGVFKLQLVTRGYRRLLADVEQNERSDALPLVRVYTRRQLRRLLASFASVELEVRHFDPPPFLRWFPALPPRVAAWCDRHLGWYIIATARK